MNRALCGKIQSKNRATKVLRKFGLKGKTAQKGGRILRTVEKKAAKKVPEAVAEKVTSTLMEKVEDYIVSKYNNK